MAFDRIRFNSRERLTATDLNRLHSLLGKDLADFLMYMFSDKNAASFVAGRADGVVGGLKVTPNGVAPTTTVDVEPGMLMQYDATAVIEPVVDPSLGEHSSYRIGRLDPTDTLSLVLGAPGATGRAYTIQARYGVSDIEQQSRDIWSSILSLFSPQNVYKRRRPTLSLSVKTGAAGVVTPPAVDAGWVGIATCWNHPSLGAITCYDTRPMLASRMMGFPQTGTGLDGSLHNTVGLYDSSGGSLPGTAVGSIDATGGLVGSRGFITLMHNSGFYVYDTTLGVAVATVEQTTAGSGHIRLVDVAGDLYFDIDNKNVNFYDSAVKFNSAIGQTRAYIDAAGNISAGGVVAVTSPRVRVRGDDRRFEVNPSALDQGFRFVGAGPTWSLKGGLLSTNANYGMGVVYVFPFYKGAGAALTQYELVRFLQAPPGSLDNNYVVRAEFASVGGAALANRTNYSAAGGGFPATDTSVKGSVDGIALDAAAADGDLVRVLLFGIGYAIGTAGTYVLGDGMVLDDASDATFIGTKNNTTSISGRCGRVLGPTISAGAPWIYPVFFVASMQGIDVY